MSNSYASKNNELEWDHKTVQFKDPVYGYIAIPKIYSKNLIDSSYMQRLKGVAQSGIRPLFSAATHDRFSHSLGVYKFTNMAFKSLKKSTKEWISDNNEIKTGIFNEVLDSEIKEKMYLEIESWRNLLSIAALLHDIGHPAGSHSFEFLYDDVFLELGYEEESHLKYKNKANESDEKNVDIIDTTSSTSWLNRWSENQKTFNVHHNNENGNSSYNNSKLKKALKVLLGIEEHEKVAGNPHERMSAYMILNSDKFESDNILKNSLKENIKNLIKAYWEKIFNEYGSGISDKNFLTKRLDDSKLEDDIRLICRMITGQKYECCYTTEFIKENYMNSLKNCAIQLINGVLDADSMDYIMRNSYSAGYATHVVDYDRLCSGFTTVENQNIQELCFSKTVLSVIEGFITARNFEPKWLYSHHKVIYYDVLLKSLYHYSVKFMAYLDYMKYSDEVKDIIEESQIYKEFDLTDSISKPFLSSSWSYPYYTYIIAPIIAYRGEKFRFHRSVDADIDAMFKSLNVELNNTIMSEPLKSDDEGQLSLLNEEFISESLVDSSLIFNNNDKKMFKILLEEYENRKLKSSLWKSHAEYDLVIRKISNSLGVPDEIIHSYMVELVVSGLEEWTFGMKDNYPDSCPGSYREQIIYRPYKKHESPSDLENVHKFATKYAADVFGIFENEYDFSQINCSCKIYSARFKDFSKLNLRFEDQIYKIDEILKIPKEDSFEFPYIFYSSNSELNRDAKRVKRQFVKRFKNYCSKRLEFHKEGKLHMDKLYSKQHVIRDIVHGDISFSDEFWDIVNAKEFQRLRRIKQLATASQVFPNAMHTRFAHSIGTYHIMKLIIEHFQQMFRDLCLDSSYEEDADIALLAALLHDVGHGPFSHAFESVAKDSRRHEEWTEMMILDRSTEINQKIVKHFGTDAPNKVVDCIKHVDKGNMKNLNFSMIYSGLVSGSLDADRMDYLIRDAYNTITQYNSVDVQNIVKAMRIAQIDGVYCVCYDESYLASIEQLIFSRFEMYDNIYFDNYKVLSETLVQCILQRAYQVRDKLDEKQKQFIEEVFSKKLDIDVFLEWDDSVVMFYFTKWKEEKQDGILAEMCRSLIDRTGYIEIEVGEKSELSIQNLLDSIEKSCGFEEELLAKDSKRKMFSVLKENRYTNAYPDEVVPKDLTKTIWIMKRSGIVRDFRDITRLHSKGNGQFWKIHKSYVFYNEEVMKLEIKDNIENQDSKTIENKIEEVDKIMRSHIPRNHIEIEEKYRCSEEILNEFENMIENKSFSPFISNGFKEHSQIDTYFDTRDKILMKNKCSLRIRKQRDGYICTIKLPVEGENFGGNSQFARFEFESEGNSNDLAEYVEFINSNLRINDVVILGENISSKNVMDYFEKVLVISNDRKKALVEHLNSGDEFQCEICLDRVIYSNPLSDGKEKHDFQIEIELKSDYLHHVMLKVFTNQVEEKLGTKLQREGDSKLNRGLMLIR